MFWIHVAGKIQHTMGKSFSHLPTFSRQSKKDDTESIVAETDRKTLENTDEVQGNNGEPSSHVPYVEFVGRENITCSTCQGTGRIPRGMWFSHNFDARLVKSASPTILLASILLPSTWRRRKLHCQYNKKIITPSTLCNNEILWKIFLQFGKTWDSTY